MLEVCPVCPDTSAKMTLLTDSSDVASSMGNVGTATASHTINGSNAVNFLQQSFKTAFGPVFPFKFSQETGSSVPFQLS